MSRRVRKSVLMGLGALALLVAVRCTTRTTVPPVETPSTGTTKYLYVASGACYAGGVVTSSGSATVTRYNLDTQTLDSVIADYTDLNPGDNIAGMINYDDTHLAVAIENTGGRRIDLVKKTGDNDISIYLINTTAFTTVLHSLTLLSDGGFLTAETASIEKFGSNKARVTQGANPFITTPAAPCATATTAMVATAEMPLGKVLFAHAAATPNNRIGMISSTGYAGAANCLASVAGPTVTALPTSILVHSGGKTLVSYGSTTASSNFIYSYDISEAGNTILNPMSVYADTSIINGPSAMAEDTATGDVYIASAASSANTIDRFSYSSTGPALTRVGSAEVVPRSVFTRCVVGLVVTEE